MDKYINTYETDPDFLEFKANLEKPFEVSRGYHQSVLLMLIDDAEITVSGITNG